MKFEALSLIFIIVTVSVLAEGSEDLYELLGVGRDATVKEIRKAFKNLAVKLHPDKNQDDEKAQEKFIKITRAYEILKEPETRKEYDIHGDTGSDSKPQYHSYSYYANDFGIYDDDPLIVTLSKADYELNVLDQNQAWFINFYSPQCHHCHTLAPTWRKLAVELEGVIRIAAVNCEDDWVLCHQLRINAYPTLLYYEKEAHVYEGEQYRGSKSLQDLTDFVLSRLTVFEAFITADKWKDGLDKKQWLLFLCPDDSVACPEEKTRQKLAATLDGLMPVGYINDPKLAKSITKDPLKHPIIFYQINEAKAPKKHNIQGSDAKEILDEILNLLPNPETLDEDKFRSIRTKLRASDDEKAWLICFFLGTAIELNLQLKRLPTMISNINIGLVHCGKSASLCGSLHVSHYPAWGILKAGGAFEIHHGRDVLHEVASFARDSSKSTNFHALSPADYKNIINGHERWFIDFYAPWCPPCRRLMPEMRKASMHFTSDQVQFGSIDCTLHSKLCSEEGIRSYPTTIFYNKDYSRQYFHGQLDEHGITEFIDDMLNPSVITLDSENFIKLMRKPEGELWMVDYFVPWCGPCQSLATAWRQLAKQMKKMANIKIAQLDCVASPDLCNAQNVKSFPTIRLYPLNSKGLNTVAMYNGHRDVISMKNFIMTFLPSKVETLTVESFNKKIVKRNSDIPWLVDFYAPWCGHCVDFEPEFRQVAELLDGKVRAGKLDCEANPKFCAQMYITSYPTVMLFFSGNTYFQISTQRPDDMIGEITEHLESSGNYHHDEL